MSPQDDPLQAATSPARLLPRPAPFQLTRYFTITSLVAFAVLAAALYFLERDQHRLFDSVQQEQATFVAKVQAQLAQEQKDAARTNLLMVHEAGHVTLTKLFSNALWNTHLAPLVARAQSIPIDYCRALAPGTQAARDKAQQACFAEVGLRIRALPGFMAADAHVRDMMAGSTVFKIKVYDMRGLTIYSSELGQVGEDKAENLGWKSAIGGKAASELVHRNRFSAFEGVVENRDLIQSYIPARDANGKIAGVFEIYSDVTPFLQQIDAGAAHIAGVTAKNQARLEEAAERDHQAAESASRRMLLIIAGLLALVYVALLVSVRNGQRIIDEEALAREQSALREQQWHREKMGALAAMAANISHEVGNPLAIISGLAENIAHWEKPADFDPEQPRVILEQAARIANMTRRITEFATAGSETAEPLDVNQLIEAVCDFLGFDGRFSDTPIQLRLGDKLPACVGIPDHLTEVLMGLLQAHEENCRAGPTPGGRILVQTAARRHEVMVRISCTCANPDQRCGLAVTDSRLESARLRMAGMDGRIESTEAGLDIYLRSFAPDPA